MTETGEGIYPTKARATSATKQQSEPQRRVCGPDVTDWFLRQVGLAKRNRRVLAIKRDLEYARDAAPWIGILSPSIVLSGSGSLTSEGILQSELLRRVLSAEAAAGYPARSPEASAQIAIARIFDGQLISAGWRALILDPAAVDVLSTLHRAAGNWRELVGHFMPYDFKSRPETLGNPTSANCPCQCPDTVTFCPSSPGSNCYRKDMPGNIFYAHLGRFVGFSENDLQLGSQIAQLSSPGGPSWDPSEDTLMIHIGFGLSD